MIWQVYYAILAVINPAARLMFRVYNRLSRQGRAKVLLQNQRGEILLVRNALGDRNWTLPGGGIEQGEAAASAAVRELHEELAIAIAPKLLVSLGLAHHAGYRATIFHLVLSKMEERSIVHRKQEIQAMAWYDPAHLPKGVQPLVTDALESLVATE